MSTVIGVVKEIGVVTHIGVAKDMSIVADGDAALSYARRPVCQRWLCPPSGISVLGGCKSVLGVLTCARFWLKTSELVAVGNYVLWMCWRVRREGRHRHAFLVWFMVLFPRWERRWYYAVVLQFGYAVLNYNT